MLIGLVLLGYTAMVPFIVNTDPHVAFIDTINSHIGQNINNPNNLPLKKLKGLTHITTDKNSNKVYHFFLYERLKNPSLLWYEQKGIKGKCKIYYIIDSETNIIIDWGFDKGGNPKTCARR